ncbi:hypothetical protein EWM64_g560 [Hericium alpestre]|uniref:Uncharacterized protein n=1 Tax=Hericium alpestre TaxID=135208 RepID=A0A4Z0AAU3_9AGAM|nr:hypothetical protein EWM64_g560 [Hericium alpestre]
MLRTRSFTFDHAPPADGLRVPPPTSIIAPDFQMPNVIVHPPEEERDEVEPCTVFDAAEAHLFAMEPFTSPEMVALDAKLGIWQQVVHPDSDNAPFFSRSSNQENGIILPRRGSFHHGRPESPLGIFTDDGSPRWMRVDDSDDVVEVVKVRRRDGRDVGEAPKAGIKKGKTFKARATQAFRSIKNVAKTKRVTAQDAFSEKEPERPDSVEELARRMEDVPARPATPKLTRRTSLALTQIFGRSNPQPSDEAPPADKPDSPIKVSSSMSSTFSIRRASSFSVTTSTTSNDTLRPPMAVESERPASPSLSTKSTTRRRLSFLNLRRVFSDAVSPSSPVSPISTAHGATSDSLPSSVEPEPETPVDEAYPHQFSPPALVSVDLDMQEADPFRHEEPRKSMASQISAAAAEAAGDISFEAHLDSLHFDSLSFDPDAFDISV